MPAQQQDNVEFLHGEVEEIFSRPPSKLGTWGGWTLLVIVVSLLAAGWMLEVPETVLGTVTLTTAAPPVPVKARQTAYLTEVLVRENQPVDKDSVLAVFSSNADYLDVLRLEKELDALSEFELSTLRSYTPDLGLRLGELAPAYAAFITTYEYLPDLQAEPADRSALLALEQYNRQLEASIAKLQEVRTTSDRELFALEKERESARRIYEQTADTTRAVSVFETYRKVSEKASQIKQVEFNIEQYRDEIANNNARMLELQVQRNEGAREKIYQLKQRLSTLKNEIRHWKSQFLLTAPIQGIVLFYTDIQPGQIITAGEDVAAIVPGDSVQTFLARLRIPVNRSGKVRLGQPVSVKVDRFPYQEYGTLPGTVSRMYPVAREEELTVEATLGESLQTSKGKVLDFQYDMSGSAVIITDNQRLVRRIFELFLPGED
ncbi:MAG: hypothetical protein RLY31_93 [Bacteroidota bacterium]